MKLEYRIGWSASSNASFRGFSDWEPWDDDEATEDQIQDALGGAAQLPEGLEIALEASGFEWWAEMREAT